MAQMPELVFDAAVLKIVKTGDRKAARSMRDTCLGFVAASRTARYVLSGRFVQASLKPAWKSAAARCLRQTRCLTC